MSARIALSLTMYVGILATASASQAQPLCDWDLRTFAGPFPRSGALAYDETRGVTVLFAGGQTWEWDTTSWAMVANSGPRTARHPAGFSGSSNCR